MKAIDPTANWFYLLGEQVHGPVSHVQLREKASAGEIGPDALIRSGNEEWRRADHVYFLSEFFKPVERVDDWWQENSRSAISKEIRECKWPLVQLVVCPFLLAGIFLVLFLLEAAGVRLGDQILGKAIAVAILMFIGGMVQAIFVLWWNGWEATCEAARLIWFELRHRLGSDK